MPENQCVDGLFTTTTVLNYSNLLLLPVFMRPCDTKQNVKIACLTSTLLKFVSAARFLCLICIRKTYRSTNCKFRTAGGTPLHYPSIWTCRSLLRMRTEFNVYRGFQNAEKVKEFINTCYLGLVQSRIFIQGPLLTTTGHCQLFFPVGGYLYPTLKLRIYYPPKLSNS